MLSPKDQATMHAAREAQREWLDFLDLMSGTPEATAPKAEAVRCSGAWRLWRRIYGRLRLRTILTPRRVRVRAPEASTRS